MKSTERQRFYTQTANLHEELGGAIHIIRKLLGKPNEFDIACAQLWLKRVDDRNKRSFNRGK